jgi:hypothetical protein
LANSVEDSSKWSDFLLFLQFFLGELPFFVDLSNPFHPQNPFNYNGGVCVAMKGEKCVAIASDHRLGAGRLTVGTDFPKVFEMGPTLYLGLPGLTSDSLTVYAPTLPFHTVFLILILFF